MPSLLDAPARAALRARFARLRPDTPARWGRFTAPAMLSHAIQSLGMMTGAVAVAPAASPWVVRHWPLKPLLIHVLPFPRGLPTSPELLARPATDPTLAPGAWEAELAALGHALDAVAEHAAAGAAWPAHVAFGPLTGHEWGVFQYRHLHHHLRQFAL